MEVNSSTSELTSSNPLDFVLLEVLPDLNLQPREKSYQQLDSDDDRPRSSSVESLVLSNLNDELRNPSVVPIDLFPDLNDCEPTDGVDYVELNHETRNRSVVTLDLFPSSKEDDKEDLSTKQSLAITTSPTPFNNNVVSCCSSDTAEVQEETIVFGPITAAAAAAPAPCPQSDDVVPTIMDLDRTPLHVPSVSIKRKPMDIDYSSPHDPNPHAPKRKKKADPCDRRKPRKRFAPYPGDELREKCAAMDKTLCRNMKVSIMLTVRKPKEIGSLGDIEELAEEFMQQLDMKRIKENRRRGVQPIHLVSVPRRQHVIVIE